MSLTQDDYDTLTRLLAQRPRKHGGCLNALGWALSLCMFVAVMAAVLPDLLVSYGVISPERMAGVLKLATPVSGYTETPTMVGVPPRQQPVVQPLPDCATVQDTRTACQGAPVEQGIANGYISDSTPTPAPTPTAQTGFWTEAERAAFTATTEAFYTDLPTPPPAFATAVQDGCNDAQKLEQSPLLRTWCGVEDD